MGEDERPVSGPTEEPAPAGRLPDGDDAGDFDEWVAWVDREIAAGRDPIPPERALDAQGASVSLGDAADIDQELLAAMCGPQGLGGEGLGPQFAQDAAADVLRPGPVLAALTEDAVRDVASLSDSRLIGMLRAACRQENREAWKKTLVIAEFARRREAEVTAAEARGVPVHCRPGEFPGEELAMELLVKHAEASHWIDDAGDLTTRLPMTLAGMAAGLIDEARAGVIAVHTRSLTTDDAAFADELLAAVAPTLRLDQLIGKAAALEMKLAPEAVKARKEHARRTRQRVEVRREDSGNASVAAREMDTGDALASKAHIHALALRLRRAGIPGTLDQLRVLVFADLTSGRDPLDRLISGSDPRDPIDRLAGPVTGNPDGAGQEPSTGERAPGRGEPPDGGPPPDTSQAGDGQPLDYDADDDDEDPDVFAPGPPPSGPRPPVPVPAAINLVVPAGTLFGWDTAPAEAGGWGLLDSAETRAIVAAASRHPATRWCVTVLGPDGTAAAHGCSPGQHPWQPREPPLGEHPRPPGKQDDKPPGRPGEAELAAFLSSLNVTLEPVASGDCDHAAAEPRYTPGRKLAHLVRARTLTCDAPGCTAQALYADLDHTVPYPDGPTDQCNLGPKCRRHHRAKQAAGWKVEQPEPGVIRWTLPSGRTHVTRPTTYDLTA